MNDENCKPGILPAEKTAASAGVLPKPHRRLLPAAALLALGAAAALGADCHVARFFYDWELPGVLRQLCECCVSYGTGYAVLLVGVLIHQLDPRRRAALLRLVTLAWGAGLAADVVKLLVARARPKPFLLDGGASVWETFTGWLPLGDGGWSLQSFPSAHTATAVGLTLALAWLYPRGRGVFTFLLAMVALQRIEVLAHYPSDVLAGAALGCIFGALFLPGGLAARGFDRWEQGRKKTR